MKKMTQSLLDNPTQQLICVDEKGKETGKIVDRKTAHTKPGIKHLAIQILVFNEKKELVLHERPTKKIGGGVLDAPTTHVLAGETMLEAAKRCLKNEYGIINSQIHILEGYSYEKDYEDGSCENEYCIAAYTVYEGEIKASKEHAPKISFIKAKQVKEEIEKNQEKYPVWLKETIKIVAKDKTAKKYF
ncbi:MAG: NUDIX domain-containing protein [Candidatus Diapherotrites archaeon]